LSPSVRQLAIASASQGGDKRRTKVPVQPPNYLMKVKPDGLFLDVGE
jgi:hypothetical protein